MADIIADTMPWEPPESARQPDLGAPSLGEKIGAQIGETSAEATGGLARALYQGQYEDSWWGRIARGIALSGAGQVGLSPEDIGTTGDLKPVAAPKVTAEEANKRYAPLGPDGQPVKITDQDLPEPVAASLGEAKAAELDRARILGAYGQQNAWPTRFATGTAAFLMDPINVGSLFLPGVGEETMLAQMGRVGLGTTGIVARTAARAGTGASAGFIGQAALEPLRYGLAQENDADYSTRQAFINLMYGAAGGAVISAGVGALGDAFRATSRSPAVKADAMRAATSQMVDGRPIDVGPVVDPQESPSATAAAQQQSYRNGFAQGIPQDEFDATKEDIYGRPGEPRKPPAKAKTPRAAQAAPAPEEAEAAAAPLHAEGAAPARLAGEEGAAPEVAIDHDHDVVSGAVGSKDLNGPVYIDRNIPEFSPVLKDGEGNPVRLWGFLATHETTERALMAEGESYAKAHVTATAAERDAVHAAGVDWAAYTHEIDGYLASIEHEAPNRVPPDPHIDPNVAIGKHTSANKNAALNSLVPRTPLEGYAPILAEHQKSGMIENAEALKDAKKWRTDKGYGGGTIEVFKSAHAEAEAHGMSIGQVNAERAALEAEAGPKLDAALAEVGMRPGDISSGERAATLDLMINRGYEDPIKALDLVRLKDVADGKEIEHLEAVAAAEGVVAHEESHGDNVSEVPFDREPGIRGEGAPREGEQAQGIAAQGEAARGAGEAQPAVPAIFAGREAYAPATEPDAELSAATAETDLAALPPSARAEIAAADANLTEAQTLQQAYAQAAMCLIEGGEA